MNRNQRIHRQTASAECRPASPEAAMDDRGPVEFRLKVCRLAAPAKTGSRNRRIHHYRRIVSRCGSTSEHQLQNHPELKVLGSNQLLTSCQEFEVMDIANINIGRLMELRRKVFPLPCRAIQRRPEQSHLSQSLLLSLQSNPLRNRSRYRTETTQLASQPLKRGYLQSKGAPRIDRNQENRARKPSQFSCSRWKVDHDEETLD